MLEDLVKNLSLITLAGAAISFVIGFIKYLDQRNREERTKRFELYHNLMRTIGGSRNESGMTQQVAAIYELQHFPEYSYASVPILTDMREQCIKSNFPPVVRKAIDDTLAALRPS